MTTILISCDSDGLGKAIAARSVYNATKWAIGSALDPGIDIQVITEENGPVGGAERQSYSYRARRSIKLIV